MTAPVPHAEQIAWLNEMLRVGVYVAVRNWSSNDERMLFAILATLEQHEALAATLEDEQAAHQDTLRLWQEAKNAVTALREQHERAMAVVAAARPVVEQCRSPYNGSPLHHLLMNAIRALDAAQETEAG